MLKDLEFQIFFPIFVSCLLNLIHLTPSWWNPCKKGGFRAQKITEYEWAQRTPVPKMTLLRHAFLRHRIGTDIWGLESGDFSKMECYRAPKIRTTRHRGVDCYDENDE
jgi:hypothetical protein